MDPGAASRGPIRSDDACAPTARTTGRDRGVAPCPRESRTGTKAQRRFTIDQICEALAFMTAKQHQAVANALTDFITRGELISYFNKRTGGRSPLRVTRQYIYVFDWHKVLKGKINKKIFKAMYVSQTFAVTDLQRLTGITERNYFDKVIRQLKKDGYITQVQRRLCAHGAGAENVYHITDRDKFNQEMMR